MAVLAACCKPVSAGGCWEFTGPPQLSTSILIDFIDASKSQQSSELASARSDLCELKIELQGHRQESAAVTGAGAGQQ
jgi:hypothetical protein